MLARSGGLVAHGDHPRLKPLARITRAPLAREIGATRQSEQTATSIWPNCQGNCHNKKPFAMLFP
eukprot:2904001-Pyramimonas_sp.AAC.1